MKHAFENPEPRCCNQTFTLKFPGPPGSSTEIRNVRTTNLISCERSAVSFVSDVINDAIDADDDILTASVTASEPKAFVQKGSSFRILVHALKAKQAI